MLPAPAIAAIVLPIIVWRVYQRVKRLLVRQKSARWRHRLSVLVMLVLLVFLGMHVQDDSLALAGMAAGMGAGAGLGILALRRTRFEQVDDDFYYVPDAIVGIVVALLFVGRLLYRGYEIYTLGPMGVAHFASGPLTLGIFGVLIGYYALYNGGLLRWRASNKQ